MPADPSINIDGIDGWNYTALRLNIHGTVDGAKMFGPNATMQDSWIHDLVTYWNDPSHADGVSHNDDVQILSGSNLRVIGNDLEGGHNSAIQISQDNGPLTDVMIDGNWADAGNVTFNIANKPLASLSGHHGDQQPLRARSRYGLPDPLHVGDGPRCVQQRVRRHGLAGRHPQHGSTT